MTSIPSFDVMIHQPISDRHRRYTTYISYLLHRLFFVKIFFPHPIFLNVKAVSFTCRCHMEFVLKFDVLATIFTQSSLLFPTYFQGFYRYGKGVFAWGAIGVYDGHKESRWIPPLLLLLLIRIYNYSLSVLRIKSSKVITLNDNFGDQRFPRLALGMKSLNSTTSTNSSVLTQFLSY